MKVYIKTNGVTLVGKAWQIKYVLKKYMKQFQTVEEWITSQSKPK
ncbi:Z-ring formation inhibitor MciZ [Pueribacillus theae]|uniref:Z-ring formation inhibitor MciZ n=1 Tax=Pueribacillus theae TaxID=2171751 RepID=A0A2U1K811_9BACI|nr:Z-ring formation inhibitor MciZ [Pueribacillus theae]PWA13173.1 Z-ring formation inhibitor MciZ [Pueribacillus theae]